MAATRPFPWALLLVALVLPWRATALPVGWAWLQQSGQEEFSLASFPLTGGDFGLIADNRRDGTLLWLTQDGGQTRSVAGGPRFPGTRVPISGLSVVDAQTAFVMFADGRLLATSDGGQTFSQRASLNIPGSRIAFASALQGVMSGELLMTLDGGASWTGALPGGLPQVTDVAVLDTATAAAVGADGSVFVQQGSQNGRPFWTTYPATADGALTTAAITADGTLYTGGTNQFGGGIVCTLPLPNGNLVCQLSPVPVVSVAVGGSRAFALFKDGSIEEIDSLHPVPPTVVSAELKALATRTVSGHAGTLALGSKGTLLRFDESTIVNHPPVLQADGPLVHAERGAMVALKATATDPDNEQVVVSWSDLQPGRGLMIGNNAGTATFTAPQEDVTLAFRVDACDPEHACASALVTVVVGAQRELAADAGPEQHVHSGETVTLDGTRSHGSIVDYRWSELDGTSVTLSDADSPVASFIAPAVSGTLTFALTVQDPNGKQVTTAVNVVVAPATGGPVANTGLPQRGLSGVTLILDGSASANPSGGTLLAEWTQTSGPPATLRDASALKTRVELPTVTAPTDLIFNLKVCNQIACDAATTTITVLPPGSAAPQLRLSIVNHPDNVVAAGSSFVLAVAPSCPLAPCDAVVVIQLSGPALRRLNQGSLEFQVLGDVQPQSFTLEGLLCDSTRTCTTASLTGRVAGASEENGAKVAAPAAGCMSAETDLSAWALFAVLSTRRRRR